MWYSQAVLSIKAEYQTSTTQQRKGPDFQGFPKTGATGLEPATSGVTGRRSNQLSYAPKREVEVWRVPEIASEPAQLSAQSRVLAVEIKLPEGAPNPAVGALVGSATGTLEAGPRRG